MKSCIKALCVFLLACTFITSCTIEKRHHLPGYHIEWKHQRTNAAIENDNSFERAQDKVQENVAQRNEEEISKTETPNESPANLSQAQDEGPKPLNQDEAIISPKHVAKYRSTDIDEQVSVVLADDKAKEDMAIMDAEDAYLFGILSLVLLFFFFLASPILASMAVKRGKRALANYTGDDISVKRRAQQGLRMGQIALIFSLILVALMVLIIVLALTFI